jgi:type IV secretory pathway TraG/TraD family ATPase VirD4
MSRLSGTTDGLGGTNHWERVAAQLLAPLLHAATIGGDDMGRVLTWVKTQRVGAAMAALSRVGNEVAGESLQSTLDTEPRQRDSAFNTVRTVLDAYEDPHVLEASRACTIDALKVVESTGALYLVATASDQARLAPLFLGLLDQVTRAAYQRAARKRASTGAVVSSDQQRLLLLLDEAANIAPIPDLATLASTAGGEGVQLLTIFQDLSQLRHRYGSEWGSIASNHVCKIALPGITDAETLRYFAQVTGDEEIFETSTSHSEGRRSTTESLRRRPILGERDLRELAPGELVALYGHRPPVLAGLRLFDR